MRRLTKKSAALALGCIAFADDASAHALAQRYDLPLPLGYFLLAAGAAVAASFVILAVFWRHDGRRSQLDQPVLRGRIPFAIVIAGQVFSVGILTLIVAAGFFGNQDTFKNIAPVAVWVIFWVGLSFVSAFVGNIWAVINPWSAIFNLVEWMARPSLKSLSLHVPYPQGLGVWPACTLFLLFAWLELIAPARDVPLNIAIAIAVYSALTWIGFIVFGRKAWLAGGEVFSVVFGLFGRFAPLSFAYKDGWRWELRFFAAGLVARHPLSPSLTAFTLLVLGTVTVDGVMETPLWATLAEQLLTGVGTTVENVFAYNLLLTTLLLVGPLLLSGLYLAVVAIMAWMSQARMRRLAGLFVLSLVPIAIAYHLAHYCSLFLVAGQFIIPLASDPFGYGLDLFGTTLYRIDIGIVDARFIWYLAVAAIVTGHVIGVCIGHVTAYSTFHNIAVARRSQYPMLVLMVGYTMLSLWILAQPIVEPAK